MRYIATALFLIFFTVFIFWGIGSWSCNQPIKESSETQQSYDAKYNNCATPYGTLMVGLHDGSEFVHTFREEITAISTFIIAVFTIILGVFTVSLARSTRIAAEVAKKSADALVQSERAHVFVKVLEWTDIGPSKFRWLRGCDLFKHVPAEHYASMSKIPGGASKNTYQKEGRAWRGGSLEFEPNRLRRENKPCTFLRIR